MVGGYWKYERRLYASAWVQVWPKSALSVAANITGPFVVGVISTAVVSTDPSGGLGAVLAVIKDQIFAALAGGMAGTFGWGLLRFWYGLVRAPFILDGQTAAALDVAEGKLAAIDARSPLQIIFDPAADDSFVVDGEDIHHSRYREFNVRLKNNSGKSIHHAEVRAYPTELSLATIYKEFRRASRLQDDRIVIAELNVIHPGEEVQIRLFKIHESARGYDRFNGDQVDLEATGIDTKMDHMTLEFYGGDDPAARRLTLAESPEPQSPPSTAPGTQP
jgi:hypothetical protein